MKSWDRMWQVFRTFSAGMLLLVLCVGLTGCGTIAPLARDVDKAAGGPIWHDAGGLICKITVTPSEGPAFYGQLVYRVATRRFVIQRLHNGALEQVGYGDGRLWTRAVPPDDISAWTEMVIFGSYVAVPFELADPSAKIRELHPMTLGGQTFRIGVVDRADKGKWAIFVGQPDNIPRALVPLAARPVLGGNYTGMDSVPKATGYAVAYEKVVSVEGVSLPSRWTVWNWDSREGVSKTPAAVVELSNPSFGDLQPSASPQYDLNMAGIGGNWWR